MNKKDLENAMAEAAGINKTQAKAALDAALNSITGDLKAGNRVALVGFGSFSTSNRAARTGRNPQTGKPMKIAAKTVVKFKAGADMSKAVN